MRDSVQLRHMIPGKDSMDAVFSTHAFRHEADAATLFAANNKRPPVELHDFKGTLEQGGCIQLNNAFAHNET